MSRLAKQRRKKLIRLIVFYITLFIILFILFITVGLKILINSSIFIANLTKKESKQKNPANEKIMTKIISIDDIPLATNSSEIIISGRGPFFDKILFFINDQQVKKINPKNQLFTEKIGGLTTGKNKVYIIGKQNNSKKEIKSRQYTVFYKNQPPSLEITEPEDKSTSSEQEVVVKGKTDQDVEIKVNNIPVVISAEGNFQTSVQLTEGENIIKITAMDNANNTIEKDITLNYSPEN